MTQQFLILALLYAIVFLIYLILKLVAPHDDGLTE